MVDDPLVAADGGVANVSDVADVADPPVIDSCDVVEPSLADCFIFFVLLDVTDGAEGILDRGADWAFGVVLEVVVSRFKG